jgi:hypothetical protein
MKRKPNTIEEKMYLCLWPEGKPIDTTGPLEEIAGMQMAVRVTVKRLIPGGHEKVVNTYWKRPGSQSGMKEEEIRPFKAGLDDARFNDSIRNDPKMRPLPCNVEIHRPTEDGDL